MRVAFLESFYTGSHRAIADGWLARSAHDIRLFTLPGRHWKWRMHGGAWQLARQVAEADFDPDLLFVTSILDIAALRSFLPARLQEVPIVAYYHENQFVYPAADSQPDFRFGFLNLTSAIAADEVWFNSRWNQQSFLAGAQKLLRAMPDGVSAMLDGVSEKSKIVYPGVESNQDDHSSHKGRAGELRILWNHRWEHDKRPDRFLELLQSIRGAPFRLLLLGETFRQRPEELARLRDEFADRIEVCGYLDRAEYRQKVASADVVVSTADHEFFGLSVMEAVAMGVFPMLPGRLSYPELFGERSPFLYADIHEMQSKLLNWCRDPEALRSMQLPDVSPYLAETAYAKWDAGLEAYNPHA